MCQCRLLPYDVGYVVWITSIVRVVISPIFLLTLIVNQLVMAKKQTTHLIFFQCHLLAYFLFFGIYLYSLICDFGCTYVDLVLHYGFYYFANCVIVFLTIMSIDMYLTFYLMDSKNTGKSIAKWIQNHLMLIGQLFGWFLPLVFIIIQIFIVDVKVKVTALILGSFALCYIHTQLQLTCAIIQPANVSTIILHANVKIIH